MSIAAAASETVNLERLIDLTSGDRREMRALVQLYIRTVTGHLAKLTQATEEKNAEQVAFAAHSAAGSSAVIGLTAIAASFRRIEEFGIQKDLKEVPLILTDTQLMFSQACDFFISQQLAKKAGATTGRTAKPS